MDRSFYFVENPREIVMHDSDVSLPTDVPPGTRAYTADGTYEAVFSGEEWVERTTGGGGGGGGASVTTVTDTDGTLDMKAGALLAAFESGPVRIVYSGEEDGEHYGACLALISVEYSDSDGYEFCVYYGGHTIYNAATADDYPTNGT